MTSRSRGGYYRSVIGRSARSPRREGIHRVEGIAIPGEVFAPPVLSLSFHSALCAEVQTKTLVVDEGPKYGGKSLEVAGWNEEAAPALPDHVGHTAHLTGYERHPHRHRLEQCSGHPLAFARERRLHVNV